MKDEMSVFLLTYRAEKESSDVIISPRTHSKTISENEGFILCDLLSRVQCIALKSPKIHKRGIVETWFFRASFIWALRTSERILRVNHILFFLPGRFRARQHHFSHFHIRLVLRIYVFQNIPPGFHWVPVVFKAGASNTPPTRKLQTLFYRTLRAFAAHTNDMYCSCTIVVISEACITIAIRGVDKRLYGIIFFLHHRSRIRRKGPHGFQTLHPRHKLQ